MDLMRRAQTIARKSAVVLTIGVALVVLGAAGARAVASVAGSSAGATVAATSAAAPSSMARDDRGSATFDSWGGGREVGRARHLVDGAIGWLARTVRPNGAVEMTASDKQPTIAATALTLLAFMASGHTAEEGQDGHGAPVRAMVGWLLEKASLQLCICTEVAGEHFVAKFADPTFTTSQMHGHAYATWAIAMADGMSFGAENDEQRKRLRKTLQAAVHVMEKAQSEQGGWGYELQNDKTHEGSVTVTVLQALRSAKEAGMSVSVRCIADAVGYLRKSQITASEDPRYGAFRYRLGETETSFALAAAAVSSLNLTGEYDSKRVDLGIDYMRRKDPLARFSLEEEKWRWYGRFYATQAYWQYKDLRWFRGWYPSLVESAEREVDDDHFSDPTFGDVYATAMAVLTLAIPFGYLPSFQR